MTPRLAFIALMTLPLAACEGVTIPGMDRAAPLVEGHKGPPGVSPLEQPIETGTEMRPVSTAEAATYNTAAFSARGNEPFWAVDVAGSTALYKTPDNQNGRPIRVNRLVFAQGVEYIGVHAGRPFALNIRAAECRDSMSGQDFPFSARLTVSGNTQTGCAAAATAETAQAVAATRAPAPATPRATTNSPRPAASRPAAVPAAAAAAGAETSAPAPASQPAASPAPTAPASEGTGDLPPPPTASGTPAATAAPIVPELRVLPPAQSTGADTTATEPAD
ncbi:hypothetical protein EYF88_08130 [Paracoccus sediminis]|uniref:Uncharacterized protein n=1 Tax=Paracoccus sediminis TaxID=1214787 RepID=A0A238WFG6_9RHOB|nr:hypothetical protein [Paracoccus sediminis]TBN50870.1 hypothetical protein EYF88_08130 [Paracoccus sediminis]SNR45320.1 hypothetical protein SAMN06265378_104155 [Paracoccus sediminis]